MTISPGTDVTVKIPNARVAKYDPVTDRYFVHSPAFYGGAWVDARNVTPPRRESWDSDWAPTPNETGAPQDGRTGGNGTGSRTAETNPAENAYPKETR